MFAQCECFLFPYPAPAGKLGISKNLGGETADLNWSKRYSILCNFILGNETVVAEGGVGIQSSKAAIAHTGWVSVCVCLKVFFLLKTLNSVTV